MIDGRPRSILYFEVLTVASIAIGTIHQLAVVDIALGRTIFDAAIPLGFALLVSRRRKNWARWVMVVMFVLGTSLIVLDAQAVFTIGYPALTILVLLLQTIALAVLFTRESSDWLRHKPPLADTFT
jgi:hypothetical protein